MTGKQKKEVENLKKKLLEMNKKYSRLHFLIFSYLQTIIALLNEKEVVPSGEFQARLSKIKKDLASQIRDAEFLRTMEREFKQPPKEKK